MKYGFRQNIVVLMIVGLVLAVASPACKFVSGGSGWVEICASDGGTRSVRIDIDTRQDSPAPPSGKSGGALDDCAFCFASAHLDKVAVDSPVIFKVASGYLAVSGRVFSPLSQKTRLFDVRGPPAVFS